MTGIERVDRTEGPRRALVTGGSSGVGRATAELLRSRGYAVTLVGRDPGRTRRVASAIGAHAMLADLGDESGVAKVVDALRGEALHALVNCAAVAPIVSFTEPSDTHDIPGLEEMWRVNLRAPLQIIRGLVTELAQGAGAVVNVSSAVVRKGSPGLVGYSATKGALEAASRALAVELAPRRIRVNVVTLGAFDTPIHWKGHDPDFVRARQARVGALIPLKRYGHAGEAAHVIVSQLESTYTTGATWSCDGGVECT